MISEQVAMCWVGRYQDGTQAGRNRRETDGFGSTF